MKVPNFTFCRGREPKTTQDFLFLFLNFDIASYWLIERVEISSIKFEGAQIHILSDVFVAVAVSLLLSYKLPTFGWLKRVLHMGISKNKMWKGILLETKEMYILYPERYE